MLSGSGRSVVCFFCSFVDIIISLKIVIVNTIITKNSEIFY
nr:MAG TPA: hypothetical protein [Caudoviricetes sp.]